MASPDIRTAVLAEINLLVAPLQVFNLSDYVSIDDLPANTTEECLLVDFVAATDRMTTIGGSGNQGWEEDGSVALHWLAPQGFVSAPILARCEAFRLALRGRRIGDVVLEAVQPFMDSGSPAENDSPWKSYSSLLAYSHNSCG